MHYFVLFLMSLYFGAPGYMQIVFVRSLQFVLLHICISCGAKLSKLKKPQVETSVEITELPTHLFHEFKSQYLGTVSLDRYMI